MIGGLVSALGFSLVDLAAIETNTVGAKLFYSFWMLGIYFTFPGIYCCFAPCSMKSFGPKHYSANYGLVYSMNVRNTKFVIFAVCILQHAHIMVSGF